MVTYALDRAEPLEWPTPKSPGSVAVYEFDWSKELATGEVITARTVTADAGLTKDSDSLAAGSTKVQATFSGGTDGRRYNVLCEITTSLGQQLDCTMVLKVGQR